MHSAFDDALQATHSQRSVALVEIEAADLFNAVISAHRLNLGSVAQVVPERILHDAPSANSASNGVMKKSSPWLMVMPGT